MSRQSDRRDPKHLTFVRSCGCCVPGCRSRTAVHAHHVRTSKNSGMGMKPSDRETVPLCAEHHQELHTKGNRTFEARHGIDLAAIARALAVSPPNGLL